MHAEQVSLYTISSVRHEKLLYTHMTQESCSRIASRNVQCAQMCFWTGVLWCHGPNDIRIRERIQLLNDARRRQTTCATQGRLTASLQTRNSTQQIRGKWNKPNEMVLAFIFHQNVCKLYMSSPSMPDLSLYLPLQASLTRSWE